MQTRTGCCWCRGVLLTPCCWLWSPHRRWLWSSPLLHRGRGCTTAPLPTLSSPQSVSPLLGNVFHPVYPTSECSAPSSFSVSVPSPLPFSTRIPSCRPCPSTFGLTFFRPLHCAASPCSSLQTFRMNLHTQPPQPFPTASTCWPTCLAAAPWPSAPSLAQIASQICQVNHQNDAPYHQGHPSSHVTRC